ncbi:MAG: hypothetical protein P1P83_13205 [Bacteroidales bacterium]|nr:hypothetical protein [Bacteroidales bacterium]MDT8372388.1 hypothetical protein [Bacteroidales bacterium]
MHELTLQNIEVIRRDVVREEISFSHLRDELTDHICCDVESEMQRGLSFSEAYQAVRRKLGSRRLREIQEETLYAVDTKYRKMKNTMKISAIAGTVLLGFASLFKIMHWPGAGIIMILGALALAFIFMPSALTVLWKETHSGKRVMLYITAFIAAMLFIAGVVFKIQHWPGSGIVLSLALASGTLLFLPALLAAKLKNQDNRSKRMVYILGALGMTAYMAGLLFKIQHWPLATLLLSVGLALIFFVVLPWYTRLTWKSDDHVSSAFIYMVVGALAIVIPSLLISLNVQRNYEGGYFVQQKAQQELINYKLSENQAIINNCRDTLLKPALAEINSKTTPLLDLLDGIGEKMTDASEGDAFSPGPYSEFLTDGSAARNELSEALREYSGYLSGLLPEGDAAQLEELLDPLAYLPETVSGRERISLMSGLHMLDLMKAGILTAESLAFSSAMKNQ